MDMLGVHCRASLCYAHAETKLNMLKKIRYVVAELESVQL